MAAVGPMIEVMVNPPQALIDALTSQNQPLPTPANGLALIDTGASRTCADVNVLSNLGINPIGVVTMGTAGGQTQCPLFPARMDFPALRMLVDFGSVVGVNLQGQLADGNPIIVLIGRDILLRGLFVYGGNGGFFSLTLE